MKETMLKPEPDARSPLGAAIQHIMDGPTGNVIHSTIKPGLTGKACYFSTVSEFWFILEGEGEIWRKDGDEERVTKLVPGTSIDIPLGTRFQYRNVGDVDVKFICTAMPPWPGDDEAKIVEGPWQPTV